MGMILIDEMDRNLVMEKRVVEPIYIFRKEDFHLLNAEVYVVLMLESYIKVRENVK